MRPGPLARDLWQTLHLRWRLLAGVLPGLALTTLHSTMLDLPRADVVAGLDSDRYRVQWIVGSYLVGSATGMALTRFFGSRIGLRRAYLLALGLFTAAGSACGGVSDVVWMTPLRLVQGFGAGLLISAAMVMLWRAYPGERGLAMALYGMAAYVPAFAGAPLGGLLTAAVSWRLIFFSILPLGIAVAAAALVLVPADRPAPGAAAPMDWIGLALLVGWVVPLNVVLDLGQYWSWTTSPYLVSWLVALSAVFAGFVAWGVGSPRPVINLRVLALPHFTLGLGIKILFSINLYVLVGILSGYMINLRGYQWWQGAVVLLPGVATMLLGIAAGVLTGRDGNRRLRMGAGLGLMALGVWLLAGVDVWTAKGWQAVYLALWGFGAGLVAGPALLTTFEGLSDEDILRTAGIFNVCRSLPVFLAAGLLTTFLTQRTDFRFDYLRQTLAQNQPAVAGMLRDSEQHFVGRGRPAREARVQAHATLAGWARANARAGAVRDVLALLALAPVCGLVLVLFTRVPPRPG